MITAHKILTSKTQGKITFERVRHRYGKILKIILEELVTRMCI
jgi:hypothetical protein